MITADAVPLVCVFLISYTSADTIDSSQYEQK